MAWSYEDSYPSVAEIAGHLAFCQDRVTLYLSQGFARTLARLTAAIEAETEPRAQLLTGAAEPEALA